MEKKRKPRGSSPGKETSKGFGKRRGQSPAEKAQGKRLDLRVKIGKITKGGEFRVVVLTAALIVLAGFILGALVYNSKLWKPGVEEPASAVSIVPEHTLEEAPVSPPRKSRGTLVFVIDDAGNNLRELEPFLRFPGPLTIAVLPALPYSAEAARRIRAAGKEVFLHQPMEAVGGQNPGPGAVYAGMNAGEIRQVILRNLAEIGPVAGMNNHQGSLITENEELMEIVLALCREEGIYFLDSRTSVNSTAPASAKGLGIRIGQRDVFLDNEPDRASINKYLENALTAAERTGAAVMIGHTWSPELALLLEEVYLELLERGYSLSTFSRFMEETP